MGKIRGCVIRPDPNGREGVYRPGEFVSGIVTLDVGGNVAVKGLDIYFIGMALTKWSKEIKASSFESDLKSTETYVRAVTKYEVQALSSGNQDFTFRFQLPSGGLPSSYEGVFGSVRYFIRINIPRQFPKSDFKFETALTILANIHAGEPQFQLAPNREVHKSISTFLGFGKAGTLHLSASLDKNGYCPGETILINLEARNESSKDCGYVKATLIQTVHFSASSSKRHSAKLIKTLVDRKLNKGETITWNQQKLTIDPVPPSSLPGVCSLIQVNYSVLVTVEIPLAFNLDLTLPITICTLPASQPTTIQDSVNMPGFSEPESLNQIGYTKCTLGFDVFPKNDYDTYFSFMNYTPMTAFVTSCQPAGNAALGFASVSQTFT